MGPHRGNGKSGILRFWTDEVALLSEFRRAYTKNDGSRREKKPTDAAASVGRLFTD
jgi:hypothetical protein